MDTPQALLERAKRLYSDGKLQESEAAFRQVIASGEYIAEAFYGVGMVYLSSGDSRSAVSEFKNALQRDPWHANSIYQLGLIAEKQDLSEEALALYRRTLAINPQHAGARRKLAGLPAHSRQHDVIRSGSTGVPPTPDVATPAPSVMGTKQKPIGTSSTAPDVGTPGVYGVYEFLLRDSSSLSKQTLGIIDSLRISVRPALTAYLATLLGLGLVIGASFVGGLVGVNSRGTHEDLGAALLALGLLVGILTILFYVTVVTTRLTIDKGRLQITRGVFARRLTNVELWRVQNIELRRTLVNRLTGDGSIIFHMLHEKKPIIVTGLCRGRQLEEAYQKLLNLVFLLRGNPVVKGIIV